jgi:glycosyltransferase involved in cell wall biosynthesis
MTGPALIHVNAGVGGFFERSGKMRIALINAEYPSRDGQGGIASYTYTLANALAAQNHTVHLLVRKGTRPDPLDPAIRFHSFDFRGAPLLQRLKDFLYRKGPILWEQGQARGVRELLLELHRHEGIDIAEIPDYGGLAYECAQPLPFPVVVAFHTPTELVDTLNKQPFSRAQRRWHRFESKAIHNATAYRCPSETLKSFACERYGIPPSAIAHIKNPLSIKLFEKIHRTYHASNDRIDLLFAGRLEYRKGIDILAGVIRDILAVDPRITMTFAGETMLRNGPLYRLRIENKLSVDERKRVWFLGPVNRSELIVLYCRSTMLLMPSLFENAPYVLLEAMAAGLPVIGADAGGIREIVRHRENGLLFSLDNPSTLVACITEFVNNPPLAAACAERAYADVGAKYAPEKIATDSVAFYQSIVNKHRP